MKYYDTIVASIFKSRSHKAYYVRKPNSSNMHVYDEYFILKTYAIFALSAGTFATSKLSANNFPRLLGINKSYFHNYNQCIL